jgi:hypothetical protein
MRTTLTLDPDVAQELKKKIETEKITLREAVNSALRAGLRQSKREKKVPFEVEPHAFGFHAGIDPDKFNQLVDELEVEEIVRKLSR